MLLVLPLLPLACIETNLTKTNEEPQVFDTGDSWTPPVDSDTEVIDTDTGEIVVTEPVECDARDFPASNVDHMEDCEGESANPKWELQEKWNMSDLGWMISSAVMVNLTDDNGNGHLDDGDVPDVIAAPYSTKVRAMNGADGSTIWEVSSSQIEQSTPAVGDVDGDGWPEVFIQGLYGSMLLNGVDGSTIWDGRAPSSIKTYCGGPGIADFDGDGNVELYFGRLILDAATGDTLAEGTGGQGTSIPGEGPISVAADIDLDGDLELVAGNTVYDYDGSQIWYKSSNPDGFPAVGNFDSDGEGEILVDGQSKAILYDTDGTEMWTYNYPSGGYGGPPAIADVDGDGQSEAIIPYQSGIAVLTADGDELWSYTHSTGSLYDGVSAYDFDGDGDYEVVLNAPTEVIIFDGAGDVMARYPNGGVYTCGQEPTMADIDNDGHADLAVTYGLTSGSGPGGVLVLDDVDGFAAALSVWNQHQFSLTNIDRDGGVPTAPEVNWLDYNTFRAGPPISYVQVNQNLIGKIDDVCNDNCDFDEVEVWWQIGNNGAADVTEDIVVQIWGSTDIGDQMLAEEIVTDDLTAGVLGSAHHTTLEGIPKPLYDIFLKIDGGVDDTMSEIEECDSTDNEPKWGATVCLL